MSTSRKAGVSFYDMYVIRGATILKEKDREKFNEH